MKIRNIYGAKILLGALAIVGLSACSTFGETHYFASKNAETGEIVNIFRLNVSGNSSFSNARYLAGYYDERAVDIFFNEVNSTDYTESTARGVGRIFNRCRTGEDPAVCRARNSAELEISPLGSGPADQHMAFVLILSTRADAISETIGAIAEDSSMKQILFRMANKDTLQAQREHAAVKTVRDRQKVAVNAEMTALFGLTEKPNSTDKEYLSILAVLARGLSPNAPARFVNWSDAETWFARYGTGE